MMRMNNCNRQFCNRRWIYGNNNTVIKLLHLLLLLLGILVMVVTLQSSTVPEEVWLPDGAEDAGLTGKQMKQMSQVAEGRSMDDMEQMLKDMGGDDNATPAMLPSMDGPSGAGAMKAR